MKIVKRTWWFYLSGKWQEACLGLYLDIVKLTIRNINKVLYSKDAELFIVTIHTHSVYCLWLHFGVSAFTLFEEEEGLVSGPITTGVFLFTLITVLLLHTNGKVILTPSYLWYPDTDADKRAYSRSLKRVFIESDVYIYCIFVKLNNLEF